MTYDDLMCVACENVEVNYLTIWNGALICSYCLEDFFKEHSTVNVFECWVKQQRKRMSEDRKDGGDICTCGHNVDEHAYSKELLEPENSWCGVNNCDCKKYEQTGHGSQMNAKEKQDD